MQTLLYSKLLPPTPKRSFQSNILIHILCLQEGKDYYFTDRATFERGIEAGKFLEYAEVHGNLYGTTYQAIEIVGHSGRCCVLDIDVQGARKVILAILLLAHYGCIKLNRIHLNRERVGR